MTISDRRSSLDEVSRIARDTLAPIADHSPPGRVNRELVRALSDTGLLARVFPESVGGAQPGSVSAFELCALREALAHDCVEAEAALAMQALGAYPILRSGTAATIQRWVPGVCRGELVAAFALSEPGAGSDAAALELRAEPGGGGYLLTGTKTWISNAPDVDVYTVFARTTDGAGAGGVTAFAVDGHAPGLRGTPIEMISGHPIGMVEFEAVPVASECVLGEVGEGFAVAMQTLDLFRPSVGASAVGMAQAALDAALDHAGSRRAFGGVLFDLQSVAHRLAGMAVQVHAARLMVQDAARAYDAGAPDITMRSSMAKLFATEAAQDVVDAAVQIHGAVALQHGHQLEHLYRAVRAPRIYEGATELQLTIIARRLRSSRAPG
ncbi:MAG: acyl-CoA dehydrogenase family protein [Candidatus Dormibacteria bacterium]|jgi:alkylation response protein AidB-like acyl-CoA dehydrogenase